MKAQSIKIKLNRSELIALHDIQQAHILMYDPVGYKDMLVHELNVEIWTRLQDMLHNYEQKKFSLKLTGAQSMAFLGYWMPIDISKYPYEMVLIKRIIELIHKTNFYANCLP